MEEIMNVLLLDNDKNMMERIARILESKSKNYRCDIFQDPDKATDSFFAQKYDLVLVDINARGLNGVKILNMVHENNPATAIIVLNEFQDLAAAVTALKYGAYAFFTKPLDFAALIDSIERVRDKVEDEGKKTEVINELMRDYVQQKRAHSVFRSMAAMN
jgi:DNA-binding NtrC family response regulator